MSLKGYATASVIGAVGFAVASLLVTAYNWARTKVS